MKSRKYKIPKIPNTFFNQYTEELLDIINGLLEDNKSLSDEVKRLKGLKGQPKIKPNTMEPGNKNKNKGRDGRGKNNNKNTVNNTNNKKSNIKKREQIIKAENVPKNAKFKGYRNYKVQELVIYAEEVNYKLERWKLPNGDYLEASLPDAQKNSHYGVLLRTFIKYQYYHSRTTEPLLLEQLREYGIKISAGHLDTILKDNTKEFQQEKNNILKAGLSVSSHINVDDTGARHKGKNGYCTHIGNELFAWFASTNSKSRINFLSLLNESYSDYVFTTESFEYMVRYKVAPFARKIMVSKNTPTSFSSKESLEEFLLKNKINSEKSLRIITEAGLIGSILSKGLLKDTSIVSDDAGQFNVFEHALCWIHAERNIRKVNPINDDQASAIQKTLDLVWDYYDKLKKYKNAPDENKKAALYKEFDDICNRKTCCYALNKQLKKLVENKAELLLVLEKPWIPLHNNLSENDIREYVTRRKISAGTRSDLGRESRDTFLSLKKTARKLGVTFWQYLYDRISKLGKVPPLSELIIQGSQQLNST